MCLCVKPILGTCPVPTLGKNGTVNILQTPPENGTSVPEGRYAVCTVIFIQCAILPMQRYISDQTRGYGHTCQDPGIWVPPIPQCILFVDYCKFMVDTSCRLHMRLRAPQGSSRACTQELQPPGTSQLGSGNSCYIIPCTLQCSSSTGDYYSFWDSTCDSVISEAAYLSDLA